MTEESRIEEPVEVEAAETEVEPEPELEAVARERDEYLDALQRLKAEFDNYRKRAQRDRESLVALAGERLVKELLPVLDDLERALEAAEELRVDLGAGEAGTEADDRLRRASADEAKLEEGVRLVHRALADALRREGLEEIPTDGAFDPHVHEAMLAQPSEEADSGAVVQVLQKGYTLGGRVLRPARVIVAE